jgi:hypothetical protein
MVIGKNITLFSCPLEVSCPFDVVAQLLQQSRWEAPRVAAPLGAHTGWNLRNPESGAPGELFRMVGAYFPFLREPVARRCPSHGVYLEKIRAAARQLMEGRYLLRGDLPSLEALSAKEWEFVNRR